MHTSHVHLTFLTGMNVAVRELKLVEAESRFLALVLPIAHARFEAQS